MRLLTACAIVVLVAALAGQLHLAYLADTAARAIGYMASIGLLPFCAGAAIGALAAVVLGREGPGWRQYWWLSLVGAVSAMVPVLWTLLAMFRREA
jgi:hypothetical protein